MNIQIISISNSTFSDYGSNSNDFIYGVQICTCSCYFNHYILWINSKEVKRVIFGNSIPEIHDLVINYCHQIKSESKGEDNRDLIFHKFTTILHFCQKKIVCSTVIGKKLSKVCYKGCYFCNKDIFFHDVLIDDCLDFRYSFCEPCLKFFLEKLVFLDLHYTDRKFIILP